MKAPIYIQVSSLISVLIGIVFGFMVLNGEPVSSSYHLFLLGIYVVSNFLILHYMLKEKG